MIDNTRGEQALPKAQLQMGRQKDPNSCNTAPIPINPPNLLDNPKENLKLITFDCGW